MDMIVAVHVLGEAPGRRIGLVKFYESGYYSSTLDHADWTTEQVDEYVKQFNTENGIPEDVAESVLGASMFGWHVPAAKVACEFFGRVTNQHN